MWIAGILVFLGWIVSVCVHEFGHAIVAYWGGDKSVKQKGYLTFNPLRYTDPGMSLVFPLIFLLMGGLALPGGAVYINQQKLRSRGWQSAVSIAGPLANVLLVLALALPFQLWVPTQTDAWLWASLSFLILLQISAVLLNLLPIPPLDGYGIVEPWLPPSVQRLGDKVSRYGFWIILALFWFVPSFSRTFWQSALAIATSLGISQNWIALGSAFFHNPFTKLLLLLILLGGLWYLKQNGSLTGSTASVGASRKNCRGTGSAKKSVSGLGSSVPGGFQTWGEAKLRKKLLQLMHNDPKAAERLMANEKARNPGQSERWYLEKLIYDLQRGR